MFALARGITYAALFTALVLVLVPARILAWAGFQRLPAMGPAQIAGSAVALAGAALAGAALALVCVLTFALVGKGTPAPFDPPRRLVVTGPYRYVRNPMEIGAGVALAGAALAFESLALLAFVGGFFLAAHLFAIWYEEPTLLRTFGEEYEAYRRRVGRWWPRLW